jgi:hypothetical protein
VKYKTALRQSHVSVKFLAVVIAGLLVLAYRFPRKATVIPLLLVTCYWAIDAYNVYRIRRRAAEDPTYLDQRLK